MYKITLKELEDITVLLDKVSAVNFDKTSRQTQNALKSKALELSKKIKKEYTEIKPHYL